MNAAIPGPDGQLRCGWSTATPEYLRYHDTEWGFPAAGDQALFERLCLECFQSGLSWRIILAKRENFRAAFRNFDIGAVARFGAGDVERLLRDAGIVRHRGKIEAVINNARRLQGLAAEAGSLAAFIWRFEPSSAMPAPESAKALSKALKARGLAFVGPTTVHAFMQAVGLVNDHASACVIHARAEQARAAFPRPVGR